jgi:hypothetical protein
MESNSSKSGIINLEEPPRIKRYEIFQFKNIF